MGDYTGGLGQGIGDQRDIYKTMMAQETRKACIAIGDHEE